MTTNTSTTENTRMFTNEKIEEVGGAAGVGAGVDIDVVVVVVEEEEEDDEVFDSNAGRVRIQ
jgi:hypothetical protein